MITCSPICHPMIILFDPMIILLPVDSGRRPGEASEKEGV